MLNLIKEFVGKEVSYGEDVVDVKKVFIIVVNFSVLEMMGWFIGVWVVEFMYLYVEF